MAMEVRIEGYDAFEQIAAGGMAAVYKARQVSIDKTVAIKILFPYLANDETFIERFQREARSAAQVQHENIVNVIDYGQSAGSYFIVMEFYEGLTVADLLKGQPRIPHDVAVTIVHEVCLGLEAAHAKDIVHRDIKPANIIFTNRGAIKIADFGLAKKSDAITVVTQAGKVLGTPAYMSPEQAAGKAVGPASDIFSLGVVAYEMLCGKRPFEGDSYSEVIEKIQTREAPDLSHENPLVPQSIQRIVERMLEKNTADRYACVADLVADLEAAMDVAEVKRDRRRLQQYSSDPVEYLRRFNERMISKCLSRGTFYMQKGKSHIREAVREFKRILFIDPENERARKHLNKLLADHPDHNSTVEIDTTSGSRGDAERAAGQKRSRGGRPHEKAERRPLLVPLLLLLAAVGAWWAWRAFPPGSPPVSSTTRDTTIAGNPTLEPPGQHEVTAGRPPDVKLQQATQTPVVEVDEPPLKKAEANRPRVKQEPEQERSGRVDWVLPKLANIYVDGELRVREDTYLSIELGEGRHRLRAELLDGLTVFEESVDVKGGKRLTLDPPRVTYGRLSVYFLGGVGELLVNGRMFDQQPPFTGVVLPAGTYELTCRMFREADSRTLNVSVYEGQTTVIEYEVGNDLAVSHEPAGGASEE